MPPAGALGVRPIRECPWCYHTGPRQHFQYSSVDKLPVRRKAETLVESEVVGKQSVSTDKKPIPDEGVLASVACSLLTQVLWATRLARPDLLRAVNHLATKVTTWASTCDYTMH